MIDIPGPRRDEPRTAEAEPDLAPGVRVANLDDLFSAPTR